MESPDPAWGAITGIITVPCNVHAPLLTPHRERSPRTNGAARPTPGFCISRPRTRNDHYRVLTLLHLVSVLLTPHGDGHSIYIAQVTKVTGRLLTPHGEHHQ